VNQQIPTTRELRRISEPKYRLIEASSALEGGLLNFLRESRRPVSRDKRDCPSLGKLVNEHCADLFGDDIRDINFALGVRNRVIHGHRDGERPPTQKEVQRAASHMIYGVDLVTSKMHGRHVAPRPRHNRKRHNRNHHHRRRHDNRSGSEIVTLVAGVVVMAILMALFCSYLLSL